MSEVNVNIKLIEVSSTIGKIVNTKINEEDSEVGICDTCGQNVKLTREYKEYKFCSFKCFRSAKRGEISHIKMNNCFVCGKKCDKSRYVVGGYCCSDECIESLKTEVCPCGVKCYRNKYMAGIYYCSVECVDNI